MIQCQVLNRILRNHDTSFLTFNNLDNTFFSDYQSEFKFIKNHLDTYGNIPDFETFLTEFPNFDVVEVNETDTFLLDELYRDKNKRYLASTFNKVRDLVNANKIDDAIKIYVNAAEKTVTTKSLRCVDIIHDVSRYDEYVEKCNDFNKFYVKTGFDELDTVIGGWDKHDELATIVARPGVGKSWVLLKCAVAAVKQGLNVGLYSGEMSESKVGYRLDTILSHISNYSISKGQSSVQNEYKKYIDELKNSSGTLKVLTPSMINGPAGVSTLRAFIEKENLDILCVDQHSLLDDDRRAKDPITRASNISKDLKNLQVLKKIPIISVSQQNRGLDEDLSTSRVAQSDRISQDSTLLLFLTQKEDVLTVTLVKSRDSETGKKLRYAIDLNHGVFNYLPEETNAVDGAGCDELKREFEGEDDVF